MSRPPKERPFRTRKSHSVANDNDPVKAAYMALLRNQRRVRGLRAVTLKRAVLFSKGGRFFVCSPRFTADPPMDRKTIYNHCSYLEELGLIERVGKDDSERNFPTYVLTSLETWRRVLGVAEREPAHAGGNFSQSEGKISPHKISEFKNHKGEPDPVRLPALMKLPTTLAKLSPANDIECTVPKAMQLEFGRRFGEGNAARHLRPSTFDADKRTLTAWCGRARDFFATEAKDWLSEHGVQLLYTGAGR